MYNKQPSIVNKIWIYKIYIWHNGPTFSKLVLYAEPNVYSYFLTMHQLRELYVLSEVLL